MTFGVASFAPERSEGANDATRDTNKLYARQKSCDYHYYQYIRTNRTNLFHMGRMFNMKSCCGRTLPFGPRKGAFQRGQFVIWPRVVIIMIVNVKSHSTYPYLSGFLWDIKEPTPLFEKSRRRRPRCSGQPSLITSFTSWAGWVR